MTAPDRSPRYQIAFTEPHAHLVDVELRVEGLDPGAPLALWMPVWTPGSYLVREYSRNVEGFAAEASDGRTLRWRKTRKNRWEVDPGGAPAATIRYRVYGRELTVRTDFVEDGFALLNGAPTFMTVAGREREPHRVRVEIPPGWAGVWTGLEPAPGAVREFVARDLDELVDSPILAGSPAVHRFTVDGVPLELVNVGEGGLWDGGKAAKDLEAIVGTYRAMYGRLPFSRYLFLNLITESRGGLEHHNSSVLMTSRYAFRRRPAYVNWLGLASHEFFHVWNVKRSRPVELGPFDYENEVYTRSLWVAEGVTAYYTDLTPRRAGLTTDAEYLEELGKLVAWLQTTPGRFLTSLEGASFDAWIKLYRPDENTANTTVSYYVKGAVVAWLLDVEIRRATSGERSLDDLMRLLFVRHSGERGYAGSDLRAAAAEVAGRDLGGFFERNVEGTGELDYDPALTYLGLRFKPEEDASGLPSPPWLGVDARDERGRLTVRSVRRDGPARAAGLAAEDEILAVGGYRVAAEDLEERLRQYAPGDRVEILIARRDEVRKVPVVLAAHPGSPWRLEIDPEASEEAARARGSWLGGATRP